MIKENFSEKKGCLRLTAVGMGFFAYFAYLDLNISYYLYPYYLKAIRKVIKDLPDNISDIILPDYTSDAIYRFDDLPINQSKKYDNVIVHHRRYMDIYSIPEDLSKIYGAVDPADIFSWKGNEYGYESVDAMMGNNSSLRVTQVPARNKFMYNTDIYIAI